MIKILTLYMVKWIGLVLMTPKTCENHGQRDKQTEFMNRVVVEVEWVGWVGWVRT